MSNTLFHDSKLYFYNITLKCSASECSGFMLNLNISYFRQHYRFYRELDMFVGYTE